MQARWRWWLARTVRERRPKCHAHPPPLPPPQIESALPLRSQGHDWRLCYSLLEHGVSLDTFFARTRGAATTVVVVRTDSDDVIGAYCSEAWHVDTHYYGTGETFLFRLTPAFEAWRWTGDNDFFMMAEANAIMVGGGYVPAGRDPRSP